MPHRQRWSASLVQPVSFNLPIHSEGVHPKHTASPFVLGRHELGAADFQLVGDRFGAYERNLEIAPRGSLLKPPVSEPCTLGHRLTWVSQFLLVAAFITLPSKCSTCAWITGCSACSSSAREPVTAVPRCFSFSVSTRPTPSSL